VRAASIMPVHTIEEINYEGLIPIMTGPDAAELTAITRRAFIPRLFVQVWESTPYMNALLAPANPCPPFPELIFD
jgi:hypothetical protein